MLLLNLIHLRAQHLTFMGMPLGVKTEEFRSFLLSKGFKQNHLPNRDLFVGPFWKLENCKLEIINTFIYPGPGLVVSEVHIYFNDKKQSVIRRLYSELKKSMQKKYGKSEDLTWDFEDGFFYIYHAPKIGIDIRYYHKTSDKYKKRKQKEAYEKWRREYDYDSDL